MVRAKFKVDSYETSLSRVKIDPKGNWDEKNMQTVELRTVKLSVVGNSSPENEKFWTFTPSGSITLSTINPEAWKGFELGKEYYVDFTQA